MGQIKDVLINLLPLNSEQKALKVFAITMRVFAIDAEYHLPCSIADYRREIEPITGLNKQVLVARAAFDINEPDGILLTTTKKAGKNRPLASFFEYSIEGETSKLIILGVRLNLDVSIKHLGGNEFRVSSADSLSIVHALVEAEVEIHSRRKRGEDKVILRRNQVDLPIKEFIHAI